jgi:hypothetical protein
LHIYASLLFDILEGYLYKDLAVVFMTLERDYLPTILGVIGLLSVGFAVKLTLRETSGRLFYIFLVVQGVIALYLLYIVATRALEAWTEYRWKPDRLR